MRIDFDQLLHGPVSQIFGEQGLGAELPVYTPLGGTAYTVDGVLDDAYADPDLMVGVSNNTVEYTFGARLSAFSPIPAQNDSITIPRVGKTFLVRDVRPDGHGWVQLKLAET